MTLRTFSAYELSDLYYMNDKFSLQFHCLFVWERVFSNMNALPYARKSMSKSKTYSCHTVLCSVKVNLEIYFRPSYSSIRKIGIVFKRI